MNERHLTEEELATLALGGLDEAERRWLEDHVQGCESCAHELESLREALVEVPPAPVPEAPAETVDASWRAILRRVEGEAAERAAAVAAARDDRDGPSAATTNDAAEPTARQAPGASSSGLPARLLGWLVGPGVPRWAAQVVVLLAFGFALAWFAAGLGWLPGTEEADPEGASRATRGVRSGGARGLLATSGYGDRLETLLIGLSRGGTEAPPITPAAREVGRELLEDGRWYRQAAARSGDASLEELLVRVETILLALVTVREGQEEGLVEGVRSVIEEEDLLWRLRTVRQSVPRPGRTPTPAAGQGS